MGTRADFYVGRGKSAEWLGSIAWDGYPKGIDKQLLDCTGEAAYRHAVKAFLTKNDGILPEAGWPWPWEDSFTTDYAYAFENEKVWATDGPLWFDPTVPVPDLRAPRKKVVFPNMKSRKQHADKLGISGMMILRAPK